MSQEPTSVLIAEDQDIMRLGLKLTLEKISGVAVVGEAADGKAATNKAKELRPKVILMDIDLPGMDGIAATREIKRELPATAVIMFTADASDESIFAALGAGADGYCLKNVSADRLGMAINSVLQGAAWLDPGVAQRVLRVNSERMNNIKLKSTAVQKAAAPILLAQNEVEVLNLIEGGKNLEEVAKQLNIDPSVVEVKVREILGNFLKANDTGADDLSVGGIPSYAANSVVGDRYIIEAEVGSGGMSTVYKARHNVVQRVVAIKMLNRHLLMDKVQVGRFHREAKAAGALNHPNIATIFDFGVTPEHQPFLVMDFIDGISLDKEIDNGPIEVNRAIKIFIQVCDALAHAHKRKLIHRDLKPSNIMLIKDDEDNEVVKLLDFGIAKFVTDDDKNLRLTRTGDLFGTPLYMSPEQCENKPTDARSDIYSLGCVMYETLTGSVPFICDSAFQAMTSHIHEQPSRLPFLAPGRAIPPELEAVVFKMLAKDPNSRPQSILEVKEVLTRLC